MSVDRGVPSASNFAPVRHWLTYFKFQSLFRSNSDRPPLKPANRFSKKFRSTEMSRLESCYESLFDAHTVESAIFWHCEIISEISSAIVKLKAASGSRPDALSLVAALDARQRYHSEAVNRLTGILQRDEIVVWQP